MDMEALEDLQRPDERSLHFSPWGLGGRMRPEDAAAFQQENVGRFDLAPQVSSRVRNRFEQIRSTYSYGVLNYGLYTAAHDQAYLSLEFALRERFVEFYGGTVTFVDSGGAEHQIQAQRFDVVYDEIHTNQRLRRPESWRLRLRNATRPIYFDGMLNSLMTWARAEGLLRGQRNRHMEPLFIRLRNFVAHQAGDHMLAPTDAALAVNDLAEIINLLWGAPTPGGRLYPAPIQREPIAIGWDEKGHNVAACFAEQLGNAPADPDGWTYVIVQAVPGGHEYAHFDAVFETTHSPNDLLWGPGTRDEAVAWFATEQPAGDQVDVLDRHLLVRYDDERRLYLPQRLDIAAGLEPDARKGTWFLVRADSPIDAFNHLRQLLAGGAGSRCSRRGPCRHCAVETIGNGTWEQVMRLLSDRGMTPTPRILPDVCVPSWQPRWNEVLGDGNWAVPTSS